MPEQKTTTHGAAPMQAADRNPVAALLSTLNAWIDADNNRVHLDALAQDWPDETATIEELIIFATEAQKDGWSFRPANDSDALRNALEVAEATLQRIAPGGSRATQGTRDVIAAALAKTKDSGRGQLVEDLTNALQMAERCVEYTHEHEGCPVTLRAVKQALAKVAAMKGGAR